MVLDKEEKRLRHNEANRKYYNNNVGICIQRVKNRRNKIKLLDEIKSNSNPSKERNNK